MDGRTIFEDELETLAAELIRKYPTGFLSEPELIRWEPNPWAIAVRVPESGCIDTPRVIIRGSYQEVRAFEIAYEKIKRAAKMAAPSMELITCVKGAVEA